MKNYKQQIKEYKEEIEEKYVRAEAENKTVKACQNILSESVLSKQSHRTSYFEFLYEQTKFIKKRWWIYKVVFLCVYGYGCNGVQREHNKKLNNGLPILHKVPPKRDYGRYFCIMAEKGGTSHGGLTEKLSLFFMPKNRR